MKIAPFSSNFSDQSKKTVRSALNIVEPVLFPPLNGRIKA